MFDIWGRYGAVSGLAEVDHVTGLYLNIHRDLRVSGRLDACQCQQVLGGVEADVLAVRVHQFIEPSRGSHEPSSDGFARAAFDKHPYVRFFQRSRHMAWMHAAAVGSGFLRCALAGDEQFNDLT